MSASQGEHPEPDSHMLSEILARCYRLASADGCFTVIAGGENRLRSVEVDPAAIHVNVVRLNSSATRTVADCLQQARVETARAMAELPNLNPQLRALLLGGT